MTLCLMLDVDGVLVDGRPGDGLRWDHDLERDLGVPADALAREFFDLAWRDIVLGKTDLVPTLSGVLSRIAPRVRAEDLVDYWFAKDARLLDPVLSDLRDARRRGLRVVLATNQEHRRATYLMEVMGLCKEVDGIVYSAQAGWRKPDPGFFRYAEKAVGHPAQDLLLVDDSRANVRGARAMGWKAVHWDGSRTLAEILAAWV